MPRRDPGINVFLFVVAIAGDGRHRTGDPVQQKTDLRAVIGISTGQHRGDDVAGVGVRGEVEHPPGPAPFAAMLVLELPTGTE